MAGALAIANTNDRGVDKFSSAGKGKMHFHLDTKCNWYPSVQATSNGKIIECRKVSIYIVLGLEFTLFKSVGHIPTLPPSLQLLIVSDHFNHETR
jgi:hypothetical protein